MAGRDRMRRVTLLLMLWGLMLVWGLRQKELDCSPTAEWMESVWGTVSRLHTVITGVLRAHSTLRK